MSSNMGSSRHTVRIIWTFPGDRSLFSSPNGSVQNALDIFDVVLHPGHLTTPIVADASHPIVESKMKKHCKDLQANPVFHVKKAWDGIDDKLECCPLANGAPVDVLLDLPSVNSFVSTTFSISCITDESPVSARSRSKRLFTTLPMKAFFQLLSLACSKSKKIKLGSHIQLA
jgi:hypothetical protein